MINNSRGIIQICFKYFGSLIVENNHKSKLENVLYLSRTKLKKRYFSSMPSSSYSGFGSKSVPIRDSMFDNPISELQKYSEIPLLHPDEEEFQPSRSIIEYSEQLFSDLGGSSVQLVARAKSPKEVINTGLPEIAMMGYSNVGKSSLIKALFNRCPRLNVETSDKPGHTKTVDFFQVHDGFVLVDMPGYGLNQPDSFASTVGRYLQQRQNVRCAFLLLNPEQGVKQEDVTVIKKLESLQIDYALIMTKTDIYSKSQKLRTLMDIRNFRDTFARNYCYAQPFLVSSVTGEGLGYLQAFIAHLCNKL